MSINVNNLWYGIAMYAALLVVCAVAVWLYNRSVREEKEYKHHHKKQIGVGNKGVNKDH